MREMSRLLVSGRSVPRNREKELVIVSFQEHSIGSTHIHNRLEVERGAIPKHKLAGVPAGQQPPTLGGPSHHHNRLLRFSNGLM